MGMPDARETSAYAAWFRSLRDRAAKARIDILIRRLSLGIQEMSGQSEKVPLNFVFTTVLATAFISLAKVTRSLFFLLVETRVLKTRTSSKPSLSLETCRWCQ